MKRNRLVAMSLLVIVGLMLLSSAAPAARNLPSGFYSEGPEIDSSAPKDGGLPPRGGDPDDVGLDLPKPPLPPMPPGEPPPPFAPGPETPGWTPDSGNGGPSFNWLLWLAMSLSW